MWIAVNELACLLPSLSQNCVLFGNHSFFGGAPLKIRFTAKSDKFLFPNSRLQHRFAASILQTTIDSFWKWIPHRERGRLRVYPSRLWLLATIVCSANYRATALFRCAHRWSEQVCLEARAIRQGPWRSMCNGCKSVARGVLNVYV